MHFSELQSVRPTRLVRGYPRKGVASVFRQKSAGVAKKKYDPIFSWEDRLPMVVQEGIFAGCYGFAVENN